MKIRIGNDIALNIHLSQKYIKDPINIKNVQCIVVPGECCSDTPFTPSKYDINRCGLPVYHMLPCCDGASYSMRQYNGFGVDIKKDEVYVADCCCNNDNQCRLEVRSMGAPDSFMAFFPAYNQRVVGKYKLIVVAELFEPGYDKNNLRTVTIDYPDVFELVSSSSEADAASSVSIQVGNGSDPTITDICISPASITDVIAGNLGMIVATVCPSTNNNQNFLWQFDDTYLNVFDDKGSTLVFKTSRIPVTADGKYNTTITCYAADNLEVKKEVPVTVYNCLDHIDIATPIDASKLSTDLTGTNGDVTITNLYESIKYGESGVFVPTVVLQNGDKVSCFADGDTMKYAVDVYCVDGAEYIDTGYRSDALDADKQPMRMIDGTVQFKNVNESGITQQVKFCLVSNISNLNGEKKAFYYTAQLAPKQ